MATEREMPHRAKQEGHFAELQAAAPQAKAGMLQKQDVSQSKAGAV